MERIPVAILGATGAVGQRFVQLLGDHPWFTVAELFGRTSAGSDYGDSRWLLDGRPPAAVAEMIVKAEGSEIESGLVFSALPSEAALSCEKALVEGGKIVCTNASAYRMDALVPLVIAEVNADHLQLINDQRRAWGTTTGALVANSNCTVMPVVISLAPLQSFGIEAVTMVSQQAISGAGYPGVSAMDMVDNIIPYVPGDEDKMLLESRKMLGRLFAGGIEAHSFQADVTCTRVPVIDGHTVHVGVRFRGEPTLEEIESAWQRYSPPGDVMRLPSAPTHLIEIHHAQERPQPRLDRNAGHGMSVSVGRLRQGSVMDINFVALSHNTIRGAAGSSILNAELLLMRGYLDHLRSD
jgi:aspartate-semialdehyde dehydrogenase